ncbi:MAG: protein phosphatase, partial [Streptomyces sp.]|nr:protein phosphatase [Streptomyces sp.]
PDLSIREVRAGDRYLICSDGLSGVVSHQTLEDTLASYQGPQETVQELIQLALRGGGPDNITVIVADVLDLDTGDTLAGQLSDTPVVVGAVAENQLQLHDNGIMQTPAGRASGLGRQVPGQGGGGGEFGPPGSGDVTGFISTDGFGGYSDDDFVKPRKGRKWLKRSLYIALALGVIGGGLYGGYRWTQTQYYVAANGDHVALYRGISQDLAWVSLSKVEKDYPKIELKYLQPYQQELVENTIAEGGLKTAQKKIDELSVQASACRKVAEAQATESEKNSKTGEGEAGGTTGTTRSSLTSKASPSPTTSTSPSPNASATPTAPTPSPGPTLSDEEKQVAGKCGT